MWRLVVIDEKLEQFGIHGRFIRAYLSTHLLLNYQRHASQETKKLDFTSLPINETKLHLLCQDIHRTAATRYTHLKKPSALLRALAALEMKVTNNFGFCHTPENWENFITDNEGTEERMISFAEGKKFNHEAEAWPFKKNDDTWTARIWQAWEVWVRKYGGDEDKALFELQKAALKQLTQSSAPTSPPVQPVQQKSLFDFTTTTAA